MLYDFFWAIPRRMNNICRRFGTLCPIFIGLWRWELPRIKHTTKLILSMVWRCVGGADVHLHSFLTSVLDGSERTTITTRLLGSQLKKLGTLAIGVWMQPRTGLAVLQKEKSLEEWTTEVSRRGGRRHGDQITAIKTKHHENSKLTSYMENVYSQTQLCHIVVFNG